MTTASSVEERPNPHAGGGRLTLWICLAIFAAVTLAIVWPEGAAATAIGGEVFLSLLKMLVVPLVVTSVMSGVIGLGDVRRLGRPGLATLVYFLLTTLTAVLIGLAVTNLLQPGVGTVTAEQRESASEQAAASGRQLDRDASPGEVVRHLVRTLFTDNLVASAARMELLPLITFSIVFAGVLTTLPAAAGVSALILQANEAFMATVILVMRLAPLGIFCLVAGRFGDAALQPGGLVGLLTQTGWYTAAVMIGLAVHGVIVLPVLFSLLGGRNPWSYARAMAQPLLMAFSTGSSAATLPVTIDSAVRRGNVSRRAADFVLPLGATVNMNGTALYEAAAVLFIAQVLGIELTLGQQAIVAVTATLAGIGAAAIPEAGLVTMVMVLTAVGLPTSEMALILGVDWLLDRFRTVVNVWGDAVGAAIVERTLPSSPATQITPANPGTPHNPE